MAVQGTSVDLFELLKLIQDDIIAGKREQLVPDGKMLFVFDPPNTYERAVGILLDHPNPTGGMDAHI